MIKPKHLAASALASVLGMAGISLGAEKRCDWHGEKVEGAQAYKKCLDIAALNNQTIEIPSNVTRISRNGLSLCLNALSHKGSADIVYLMDQSSSMTAVGACRTPEGDTLYFERAPKGTELERITIPFKDGTKTIPLMDNCSGPQAGDPFGIRAIMVKEAIKIQQNQAIQATAGFAAYKENVEPKHDQTPLEITKDFPDAAANIKSLFSKIYLNSPTELPLEKSTAGSNVSKTAATGWSGALEQARLWLKPSSGYTRTQNQAIVMVSDGRPSDWALVELMMDSASTAQNGKMPPVYGIHLGNTDPGEYLKDLASLTGGQWYMVPPGDADSLRRVMASIVGTIVKSTSPKSARVVNTTLNQESQTGASAFSQNPDGGWVLNLPDVVALGTGKNLITVEGVFNDSKTGKDTTLSVSFTLDVKGAEVVESGKFVTCYEPSTLQLLDAQGKTPAYLSRRHTAYQLRLRTLSEAATQEADAATSTKKDLEIHSLTLQSGAGEEYQTYGGSFNFSVSDDPLLAQKDGKTQAARQDRLTVSWVHPRDLRDTASISLDIRDPRASIAAAAYLDENADGYLDRMVFTFAPDVPPFKEGIASHPEIFGLPDGMAIQGLEWRGDTLSLAVKPHVKFHAGPIAVISKEIAGLVEEGYLEAGTIPVADLAAPVAVKGRFKPGMPAEGVLRTGGLDTLWVTFSEPFQSSPLSERPFRVLSKERGTEYVFVLTLLENGAAEARFLVTAIEGATYPGFGDSLWIEPGAIRDAAGNVQNNPRNRRAPLETAPPPSFKGIRPLAPVAKPQETQAPIATGGFAMVAPAGNPAPIIGDAATGKRLEVLEPGKLLGQDGQPAYTGVVIEASRAFTAKIWIYDHFGAFVHKIAISVPTETFETLEAGAEKGTRALRLAWDGRSMHGHSAGTGVYIFNTDISLVPQGGARGESLIKLMRVGLVRSP